LSARLQQRSLAGWHVIVNVPLDDKKGVQRHSDVERRSEKVALARPDAIPIPSLRLGEDET
jgi:hypothetical protein